MKKVVSLLLSLAMITVLASCSDEKGKNSTENAETTQAAETTTTAAEVTTEKSSDAQLKYEKYASMTPEEIVAQLTLEQKAAQMVQPAIYMVADEPEAIMKEEDFTFKDFTRED